MSVINDMLAQLDKRRAEPVTVGDAVVVAPAAAAPATRWKLLAVVGVGAVAVSATALGNWPDLMRPKLGHLPQVVGMVADGPVAAASAVVVAVPPIAAPVKVAAAMPASAASVASPKVVAAAASAVSPVAVDTGAGEARPVLSSSKGRYDGSGGDASIDKKMAALSPVQRAEQTYRQASEMAASGHSTQAIERALEALQDDPAHVAARQLAAVLMVEKSRFDEAATLLREGLDSKPAQPQLSYLLARIKAETGDRAGALALLQADDSLSAEGFALRAALLSQQGQYGAALPSYEAALRRNPDTATVWLGLAVALDAEGQTGQARQAYLRAKAVGAARGELSGELQTYIEQKLAATR